MSNIDIARAAELLLENYYTVKVRFDTQEPISSHSPKLYTYKVPNELKLEKDDFAIVRVRGSGIIKIVQVIEVDEEIDIDFNFNKPYSWIIQKADADGIVKREELDAKVRRSFEVVKKRQMRKELLAELTGDLGEDSVKELFSDLGLEVPVAALTKTEKS